MKPIDELVSRRVREAREEAGMTQRDLAPKINVTQQAVSRYETGALRVSLSQLVQIAEVTGKPLHFFLHETPKETAA